MAAPPTVAQLKKEGYTISKENGKTVAYKERRTAYGRYELKYKTYRPIEYTFEKGKVTVEREGLMPLSKYSAPLIYTKKRDIYQSGQLTQETRYQATGKGRIIKTRDTKYQAGKPLTETREYAKKSGLGNGL